MPAESMTRPRKRTFVRWEDDPPEEGDYLYGPVEAPRAEPHYELIVGVRPGRVHPWIVDVVRIADGDVAEDGRVFSWCNEPRRRR